MKAADHCKYVRKDWCFFFFYQWKISDLILRSCLDQNQKLTTNKRISSSLAGDRNHDKWGEGHIYLLLHQENLLILCIYLFVMNQLLRRAKETRMPLKRRRTEQKALEYFCIFVTFTFGQYLHFYTFRTGGFVIKSSNGSSGLTVVKFSCKIPIFFSLSHPDGLKEKEKIFKLLFKKIWRQMPAQTVC